MDGKKLEVAYLGAIVNDSQIFFEVTGPHTHDCVLGMGAGIKLRDVFGPSSSSHYSKWCQEYSLKENEDCMFRLKEIEYKRFAKKK